jgi:hypothetical protein
LIICLYSYNLMGYYHRFLCAIPQYEVGLLPFTHPSAGRHLYTCVYSAAPRLACIKPAASVHPEPGSNSPYLFLFCTSSRSSSSLAFVKLFFPLLLSSPQFTSFLFLFDFCLFFNPFPSIPSTNPSSPFPLLLTSPFIFFFGTAKLDTFFYSTKFFLSFLKKFFSTLFF